MIHSMSHLWLRVVFNFPEVCHSSGTCPQLSFHRKWHIFPHPLLFSFVFSFFLQILALQNILELQLQLHILEPRRPSYLSSRKTLLKSTVFLVSQTPITLGPECFNK